MELIKNHLPDIRFLYDLKDVLYDQEWFKQAPNLQVYYIYRDLADNKNDQQKIQNTHLRYDITLMEGNKFFGKEFPKTLGHEHPLVPQTNCTFPEIYEVLNGEAYYLAQKQKNSVVENVFAIHAKTGDKIIIPPNYGHVTINASGQELKMANWSERNFKSDYSIFQNNQGACYYALCDSTQNNALIWHKNDKYQSVPDLKIFEAADFLPLLAKFGLDSRQEMYRLIDNLEKLDFLKEPQKYSWI